MSGLVWVVIGSLIGAPLRYVVDAAVHLRLHRMFAWGTLVVNASGSLALGLVLGSAERFGWSGPVLDLLAIGLLGSYTTFSTYVFETLQMVEGRRLALALGNAVGSIAVGMAAVSVGLLVG